MATGTSPGQIAHFLEEVLGRKLVAYVAGASGATDLEQWLAEAPERAEGAERRLGIAYHVFRLLQTQEGQHTVRAWFLGLNPQLDDRSPATALREGKFREVVLAAEAFLAGG